MPTASHRSLYPLPPVNLRCQYRANRTRLKMHRKPQNEETCKQTTATCQSLPWCTCQVQYKLSSVGKKPDSIWMRRASQVSIKFCQTTKQKHANHSVSGVKMEIYRTLQDFAPGPSHGARTMTAEQAFCPPWPMSKISSNFSKKLSPAKKREKKSPR